MLCLLFLIFLGILSRQCDLHVNELPLENQAVVEIAEEDPKEFFVRSLAEGVGRIACAFYPKPVIVRMSDFKSNEYKKLIGGSRYEPDEENPMLGFRGASRYIAHSFRDCFELECRAIRKVRDEMGFTNVEVQSIRNYVFPGNAKYRRVRQAGVSQAQAIVELTPDEVERVTGSCPAGKHQCATGQ